MNEESARMMELARRDLRAAQGMAGDTVAFTDEILPSFLLQKTPCPFFISARSALRLTVAATARGWRGRDTRF